MKINRKPLKDALEKIFPALIQKTLGKGPTFVFSGKYIAAFNGTIGIAYSFPTDFQAELPAEEFYKIISLSDLDEIEINIKGNICRVEGPGLLTELSIIAEQTDIQFIEDIKKAKKNLTKLPQDILEALSLCLFSVSMQNGFAALQCIAIDNGYVISTDSYRISRYKIGKFPKILIPSSAVENILKYNIDQYWLSDDKTKIYFIADNIIIYARLVLSEFPSCDAYFKKFNHTQIAIPTNILPSLNMVSVFASNDDSEKKIDKQIVVDILKNKWVLKARNDFGSIEKEVPCKNSTTLNFIINPFFLKEAIDKALLLSHGDGKVLLTNGKFEHIISLGTSKE